MLDTAKVEQFPLQFFK